MQTKVKAKPRPDSGNGKRGAHMELDHPRLGRVEYDPAEVVDFPQGLPGFIHLKAYLLIKNENTEPFVWLVSVDDPAASFLMVNPLLFNLEYNPTITKRDLTELSITTPQSLLMYSIVTLNSSDYAQATANLSGPILINLEKKIGKQLVLLDDRYSTKHRILTA
jgi:flagellar assembly factor FliW